MKRDNKVLLGVVISCIFLLAYIAFSFWVYRIGVKQADFDLMVRIQNNVPKSIDGGLSVLSIIGSFEITTLVVIGLLIFRRKLNGLLVFGFYGLGLVIEVLGKSLIPHLGPTAMFYRYHIGFLFPSSYIHTSYSYPSGHAYRSVFIVMVLAWWIWNSRRIGPGVKAVLLTILAVFLAVVLISRVSLGEHWTSDVIGGTLIGIAMGTAAICISEINVEKLKEKLLSKVR